MHYGVVNVIHQLIVQFDHTTRSQIVSCLVKIEQSVEQNRNHAHLPIPELKAIEITQSKINIYSLWDILLMPVRSETRGDLFVHTCIRCYTFFSKGTDVLVWHSARRLALAMDQYDGNDGVHIGMKGRRKVIWCHILPMISCHDIGFSKRIACAI